MSQSVLQSKLNSINQIDYPQDIYQELQQYNQSSSKQFGRKYKRVEYDPTNNIKNIFLRKLNQEASPKEDQMFSDNPLTQLLQPQDDFKKPSKRFIRDKLDISDMKGVKPDVYGFLKYIEGRADYLNTEGIQGAQPSPLKQNQQKNYPDLKLYVKDINPDKWHTKRIVDPQNPVYEVPTKSGRVMRIGQIERSTPQPQVSVSTKRIANYVGDIEGTKPKKGLAISDIQRQEVMSNNSNYPYSKNGFHTRNQGGIFDHMKTPLQQSEHLKQASHIQERPPPSHYARFQNFKQQQTHEVTLRDIPVLSSKPPLNPSNQRHSEVFRSPQPTLEKYNAPQFESLKESIVVQSRQQRLQKTELQIPTVSRRFQLQSLAPYESNPAIPTYSNPSSFQSIENQNDHLMQIQKSLPRISSKREEVWSTARKLNTEFKPTEIKISEPINPRRMTDITAKDLSQKYFQLNNNKLERKPLASINPINHEVTFGSQDRLQASRNMIGIQANSIL